MGAHLVDMVLDKCCVWCDLVDCLGGVSRPERQLSF